MQYRYIFQGLLFIGGSSLALAAIPPIPSSDDYNQIKDATQRYAVLLDSKDYAALSDFISPTVTVNFLGDVRTNLPAFIGKLHDILDPPITSQHMLGTQLINHVDNDTTQARVKTYVQATLFAGNRSCETLGVYDDQFTKESGSWMLFNRTVSMVVCSLHCILL